MNNQLVGYMHKSTRSIRSLSFMLLLVIMVISVSSLALAAEFNGDDLMALQGNVVDSVGNPLNGANLRVVIYDNVTGGTLIYNSSTDFNSAINNGRFDVFLGNGSQNLSLEYNQVYYIDMEVNGEDLDFNGQERQVFQSSIGEVRRIDQRANNSNALYVNKSSTSNGLALLVRNAGTGNGVEIENSWTANRTFPLLIRNATSVVFSVNDIGNVTANGLQVNNLVIAGNLNVGGTLTVGGEAEFQKGVRITSSGLNVSGPTNLTGTLTVGTTSILKQSLTIETGGLTVVSGGSTFGSGLQVSAGGLNVTGDANLTGGVVVGSDGIVVTAGGVTVTGSSTFNSDVRFNAGVAIRNLTVENNGTIRNLTVSNGLAVSGGSTLDG
ncbi:hypothetical protein HY639_02810, partial [Candidatus Woesearchaeota archaeon]|nr:hypothetical protein [Candidatus Woesearchaeota archaeon]